MKQILLWQYLIFSLWISLSLNNYRFQSFCIWVALLAYSANVSWLVALRSMFAAVNWILYRWIQHHALQKHQISWPSFDEICCIVFEHMQLCKTVSHVYYCRNHNDSKSDFSRLSICCYKKWWLGYLLYWGYLHCWGCLCL